MVEKKVNVLVIPAWYSHKNKTEGLFIDEFCNLMQNETVNISLLYLNFYSIRSIFNFWFGSRPKFDAKYKVITVNLLDLKSKLLFFLSNSYIINRFYIKILKTIKQSDLAIDVIHIQSLCNNVTPFVSERLAKELKLPYVLTEHYSSFDLVKGKLFKPYLTESQVKQIAAGANARIAVSAFAARKFESYFNSDFNCIGNFVNDLFFQTKISAIKPKQFTFIIIAALESHKGVEDVVNAFIALIKTNPEVRLKIVGEGSMKQRLEQLAVTGKAKHAIVFLKRMETEEIIEQLDMSHCLISASDYETFGLTIAEAHLRGLPVIATQSGGANELLNPENGILIPLEFKDKTLLKAMQLMTNSYNKFDTEGIRKTAFSRFNKGKIVDSYSELYHKVINYNPPK
jgi:glycosyltransferase involved in cell wall biosynthesis